MTNPTNHPISGIAVLGAFVTTAIRPFLSRQNTTAVVNTITINTRYLVLFDVY